VTESHNFYIPSNQNHEFMVEHIDHSNDMVSNSIWALDSLLIDEEMLYAEAEEADRIYQELKNKVIQRKQAKERSDRLRDSISADM